MCVNPMQQNGAIGLFRYNFLDAVGASANSVTLVRKNILQQDNKRIEIEKYVIEEHKVTFSNTDLP